MSKELQPHEAAELFPPSQSYDSLIASVKKNGLVNPIITYQGKILDGVHRQKACLAAGVKPRYQEWKGKDPFEFARTQNLDRRDLTTAQKVACAVKDSMGSKLGDNQHGGCHHGDTLTQGEAAERYGIARQTVAKGHAILRMSPEIFDRMWRGEDELTVRQAEEQARAWQASEEVRKSAELQRKLAEDYQRKADALEEELRQIKEREKKREEEEKAIKAKKEKEAQAQRDALKRFPKGKFAIIYADPPWEYPQDQHTKEPDSSTGSAGAHYPTMSFDDLTALRPKINTLAAEDCLLFMWTTGPKLKEAVMLGDQWGFKYVTVGFDWDKESVNPGDYTMSQHEYVLIFKRGKIPQPRGATNIRQSVKSNRTKHSAKPIEVAERIERMFPKHPKIELFARNKREGWTAWGTEV